MVEGVIPDQVPIGGDSPRHVGEGLDPATLQEERGADVQAAELVEDPGGVVAVVRAIGVLGVEGQRDPRPIGHFSTPVITMPRMKARCATKKTAIGMMIVISVAACTSSGLLP